MRMQLLAPASPTVPANPNPTQTRSGPMILPMARPARQPAAVRPNPEASDSKAQLRSLGIGSHVDTFA